MRVLAVDTATDACTCALLCDGSVHEKFTAVPRRHADLVLGMIDELLVDVGVTLRQLDAIAFGRGPGSFTGLRIAAGVVQGLAFGADLPAVPVSTLQTLAETARQMLGHERVACAFDARMNEVYWGAYEFCASEEVMLPACSDVVCNPRDVPLPSDVQHDRVLARKWTGVGGGWECFPYVLLERFGEVSATIPGLKPRAGALATLGTHLFRQGKWVSPADVAPIYLRNQVTRTAADSNA